MPMAPDITLVTPTAPIAVATHGGRAKCLQRLVRLDLPVPRTVVLSFDTVLRIANGELLEASLILSQFCLLYTSPSPRDQRGSRMPSSA